MACRNLNSSSPSTQIRPCKVNHSMDNRSTEHRKVAISLPKTVISRLANSHLANSHQCSNFNK
jgi:hypothetical protein